MVCAVIQNIRLPAPAPTVPLRERVRLWLAHRPGPNGRYEGYRPDFSNPASPQAIHDITGVMITFTPEEVSTH